MRVTAFNGSPRKDGNTFIMLDTVIKELEKKDIEGEVVQVGGQKIHGCVACQKCFENDDHRCVYDDDILNSCIDRMIASDAIILGSPTYFGSLTPEIKALMDRSGMVTRAQGGLLKRKIGAAVAVHRRAGSMVVFNTINNFFLINNMIVPGSTYWNVGVARQKHEINEDEEAFTTMKNLAANISWLLENLK